MCRNSGNRPLQTNSRRNQSNPSVQPSPTHCWIDRLLTFAASLRGQLCQPPSTRRQVQPALPTESRTSNVGPNFPAVRSARFHTLQQYQRPHSPLDRLPAFLHSFNHRRRLGTYPWFLLLLPAMCHDGVGFVSAERVMGHFGISKRVNDLIDSNNFGVDRVEHY